MHRLGHADGGEMQLGLLLPSAIDLVGQWDCDRRHAAPVLHLRLFPTPELRQATSKRSMAELFLVCERKSRNFGLD